MLTHGASKGLQKSISEPSVASSDGWDICDFCYRVRIMSRLYILKGNNGWVVFPSTETHKSPLGSSFFSDLVFMILFFFLFLKP